MSYGSRLDVAAGAGGATSAVAEDLDGDGDADVVAALENNNAVAWYENNGAQSFASTTVASPVSATGAFPIDVDGDADVDIVSCAADGAVAYYLNDGAAATTCSEVPTDCVFPFKIEGVSYSSCARVGVDGTGDRGYYWCATAVDAHSNYDGSSEKCDGCDATQSYSSGVSVASSSDNTDTEAIYAVDVDLDGDVDVLVASFGDNLVRLYENDGSETFTSHDVGPASGASAVSAIDLDGDTDLDVVAAAYNGVKFVWFEHDGSLGFGVNTVGTALWPTDVDLSDVDGDSEYEVIGTSAGDDSVGVFYNNLQSTNSFVEVVITANQDEASAVFCADLDGDADVDVVSGSSGDNTVEWYAQTPTLSYPYATWATYVVDNAATGVTSVQAYDLNDDGDYDLVAALTGANVIGWYNNDCDTSAPTGAPTVSAPPTFAPSPKPTEKQFHCAANNFNIVHIVDTLADGCKAVELLDLDGDWDVDILSASWGSDAVAWYDNDGDQSFTKHEITDSTYRPRRRREFVTKEPRRRPRPYEVVRRIRGRGSRRGRSAERRPGDAAARDAKSPWSDATPRRRRG